MTASFPRNGSVPPATVPLRSVSDPRYNVPRDNTGDASVGINQAIQDELAALVALGVGNRGSVVYVPPGVYRCLAPVKQIVGQYQVLLASAGPEAVTLSFPNDLSFTATCSTHATNVIDGIGSFSGGHTINDVKAGMGVSGYGIPEMATVQTVNAGTSTVTISGGTGGSNLVTSASATGQPIRFHPFALDVTDANGGPGQDGYAQMNFEVVGLTLSGVNSLTQGGLSSFTAGVKLPSGAKMRDCRVTGFGYGVVRYGDHTDITASALTGNGFNEFYAPGPLNNNQTHRARGVVLTAAKLASTGLGKQQYISENYEAVHFGFAPHGIYQVNDEPSVTGNASTIANGLAMINCDFESCGHSWLYSEDGSARYVSNRHIGGGGGGLDSNFQVAQVTPTGTTANGSFTVGSVSSFTGIVRYMPISGPGIPVGTHVFDFNAGAGTITLSQPAGAAAGAGTLTIGWPTSWLTNIGGAFDDNAFLDESASAWLGTSGTMGTTLGIINCNDFQGNRVRFSSAPSDDRWSGGRHWISPSATIGQQDSNRWDAEDGTAGYFARVNSGAAAVGQHKLLERLDYQTVALYPAGSTTAEVAGVNAHSASVPVGEIFAVIDGGSISVPGQASQGAGAPSGWVKPDPNVNGSLAAAAGTEMTAPRIGVSRGNGLGATVTITASATNGQPTLTGVSSFADIANGTPISGTGIPGGTTVLSFVPGASITMSANFTGTTGAATITVGQSYQVKLKGIG